MIGQPVPYFMLSTDDFFLGLWSRYEYLQIPGVMSSGKRKTLWKIANNKGMTK